MRSASILKKGELSVSHVSFVIIKISIWLERGNF